jgi:hypothetical protein
MALIALINWAIKAIKQFIEKKVYFRYRPI